MIMNRDSALFVANIQNIPNRQSHRHGYMRCGDVVISTIVAMTPCCRERQRCHYVRFYYSAAALLAMQSAVLANSVRPSVCLSVTRWYPIQTNKCRITRSSLWCSKNTLVRWYQQWLGRRPLPPKIYPLSDPPPSEKCWLGPISAYNV